MKEFFKKLVSKWKRDPADPSGGTVLGDWETVIVIFLAAFVLIVVGHYVLYLSVSSDESSGVGDTLSTTRLKAGAMRGVLEEYSEKTDAYNELWDKRPRGINP